LGAEIAASSAYVDNFRCSARSFNFLFMKV
jgi:hypothetical protein